MSYINIITGQVTQPLLCEQLRDWAVDISSRQLNRILQQGHEDFHQEKDDKLLNKIEQTNLIRKGIKKCKEANRPETYSWQGSLF